MGKVSVEIRAISGGVGVVNGYARASGTITASGVTSNLRPVGGRELVAVGVAAQIIRASIDVECPQNADIEYSKGDLIKLSGGTIIFVSVMNVDFFLHCSISGKANHDDDTTVDPGLGLEWFISDTWEVV